MRNNLCRLSQAVILIFHFCSCFKGHKNVNRAIIHVDEAQGDTYKLLVEGDDLLSVMSTVGQLARRFEEL